ncbi:MAG: hypothetical protein OXR62_12320 [Ahrensia sp.]|nr:hypothetical protein [Ahrensia sp.]
MGAKSRALLPDQMAVEKTKLIGFPLPCPGIGYVERTDIGFRFVAA